MNATKRIIQRVIGYKRMSVEREHHSTLITQDEAITRKAEYERWELTHMFVDAGKSAYDRKTKRPDFEKAIRMIETGEADAIVVFKLDRFSRSISEFWEAWQRIKAAGGHFISISENFDTSTTMGEMMLLIIAGFAQMESDMKRDRSIPMHRHHKEIGKVAGGPRPYGYDKTDSIDNNKAGAILTVNKREADLIRTAASHIIAGGSLTGFIATHQPESSRANKLMTYRGLKSVLVNPTTAGFRTLGDGFSKGQWEAILDVDTWQQLRTILLDPARLTSPNGNQTSHLLSGVMSCHKCSTDDHQVTVHSRNWVNPKSRATSKRYMCPKCLISLDADSADKVAIDALFEAVPQAKWDAWQTAGKGWDPSLIADLESRLAAFDAQFSKGKLTEQRWMNATADVQEQIDSALNNEPLDLPELDDLQGSWPTLALADKQRVFRQAFTTINLLGRSGSRNPLTRMALVERT